ncbi:MAG: hypothetical protein K9M57_05955 [Phycisphaerae bacterium]|nr:hypothetical protein [Phycisphaerae bacterium]
MSKAQIKESVSIWRFRREVSLGTLLHVLAILVMVITAWCNLQNQFVLIRRDLNELIRANVKLNEQLEKLSGKCLEHEYRINNLEGPRRPKTTGHKVVAIHNSDQ